MDSKEIKKNLKYLQKYGDMYDCLAKKEGVHPEEHSFLNFQALLLSRLLFIILSLAEKIKDKCVNLKKVKEASDNIREYIGVNIDIIINKTYEQFKIFKISKLGILYGENTSKNTYLNNLEKILKFMENYKIAIVYLKIDDLINNFSIDLNDFHTTNLKTILGGFLEPELDTKLLALTNNDLLKLIAILKSNVINKKYIFEFKDKIDDFVIKKALADYLNDFDLKKLNNIITKRLSLFLNSDNSFKDKINGKVYFHVILKDKYVKVIAKNIKGEIINTNIMLLKDYLNYIDDNTQIKDIGLLYLALNDNFELKNLNNMQNISFYDKLYKAYLAKNKEQTKIRGLKSKSYKRLINLYKFAFSLTLSSLILVATFLTGISLDSLNHFLFSNQDSSILENVINTVILPYKYSLEFELNLIKEPLNIIGDTMLDFWDRKTYSVTGDSTSNIDKIIAEIKPLNSDYPLPVYYASSYAISTFYKEGSMHYMMDAPTNLILKNLDPLFTIDYNIDKNYLEFIIQNNELNLQEILYPLGNYGLISICFKDYSSDNIFTIDYNRFMKQGNTLTSEEIDFLKTFKNPYITYTYGVCLEENIFDTCLKENAYIAINSEVKSAILQGLNLNNDASLNDIYEALKNKKYSKEPLKEAGISRKVKRMDELEYMQTIASMDSLICNLAASLIVESNSNLSYVIGYANFDGNEFLRSSEYHAWAMDREGHIIDATPPILNEEESFMKNILDFGVNYHIPLYAIIVLISLILKKIFGKKVAFTLKFNKINKLLDDKDIIDIYAKINELLYGGINIPKEEPKDILLRKVVSDFSSLEKQELEILKSKLKEIEDKNTKKRASKLLNEIPFIEENTAEILRKLNKK